MLKLLTSKHKDKEEIEVERPAKMAKLAAEIEETLVEENIEGEDGE